MRIAYFCFAFIVREPGRLSCRWFSDTGHEFHPILELTKPLQRRMGPLLLRQESLERNLIPPLVSCGSSTLKEVCKVTPKANTSLVVHGSSSKFFFCIPAISPPPRGKWGFTFRTASEERTRGLPERFFLPWDSEEGCGIVLWMCSKLCLC